VGNKGRGWGDRGGVRGRSRSDEGVRRATEGIVEGGGRSVVGWREEWW